MADKKIMGLTVQTDPIAIGDLFEMIDISEGTLSMKNKQVTGTKLATFINTNLLGVAYVIGDLIYANTPTTLSKILAGTNGHVLTSNGPGIAPTYQAAAGGISGLTAGRLTKATSATTIGNSEWVESGASLLPATDAVQAIGSSTFRLANIFLAPSFAFISQAASGVSFRQGGVDRLVIGTTGYVSVGAPAATTEVLNIGGAVLLGTATGTTNGTLRYTGTDFEGRIGGVWTSLSASGSMAIGGSITSATAGSVLFAGVAGVLAQDNANLFWDDANNRLGIGIAVPTARIHVKGTGATSATTSFVVHNSTGTNNAINVRDDGNIGFGILPNNTVAYYMNRSGNTQNTLLVFGDATDGYATINVSAASLGVNINMSLGSGTGFKVNTMTTGTSFYSDTLTSGTGIYTRATSGIAADFGASSSGVAVKASGRVNIIGSGSTISTTSLNVVNSAAAVTFKVYDSAHIQAGDAVEHNQFVGVTSGLSITVGSDNVSFGFHSLRDIVGGSFNSAFGSQSMRGVTSGSNNTAIGYRAMLLGNASECTFVGANANSNAISGNSCTGVGTTSLSVNTGSSNTAIGGESLSANTTGLRNTAIGFQSGVINVLGSNLIFIGYNSRIDNGANTFTNSIAIGSSATITGSNQFVVGDGSANAINNAFIGRGVHATIGNLGTFTLNATGVTAGVADQSAAASVFYIAGAKGTGTGAGGSVIIQTATAGASGSTQNALVDQLIIKTTGTINMANLQTGNAGLVSGDLYKDTAANILINLDLIVARKV